MEDQEYRAILWHNRTRSNVSRELVRRTRTRGHVDRWTSSDLDYRHVPTKRISHGYTTPDRAKLDAARDDVELRRWDATKLPLLEELKSQRQDDTYSTVTMRQRLGGQRTGRYNPAGDGMKVAGSRLRDHVRKPEASRYADDTDSEGQSTSEPRRTHTNRTLYDGIWPARTERQRALQDAMRALISQLKPDHAQAVQLCDIEQLSYADAAREVGVSKSTMQGRVERGRAALRALIVDTYDVA